MNHKELIHQFKRSNSNINQKPNISIETNYNLPEPNRTLRRQMSLPDDLIYERPSLYISTTQEFNPYQNEISIGIPKEPLQGNDKISNEEQEDDKDCGFSSMPSGIIIEENKFIKEKNLENNRNFEPNKRDKKNYMENDPRFQPLPNKIIKGNENMIPQNNEKGYESYNYKINSNISYPFPYSNPYPYHYPYSYPYPYPYDYPYPYPYHQNKKNNIYRKFYPEKNNTIIEVNEENQPTLIKTEKNKNKDSQRHSFDGENDINQKINDSGNKIEKKNKRGYHSDLDFNKNEIIKKSLHSEEKEGGMMITEIENINNTSKEINYKELPFYIDTQINQSLIDEQKICPGKYEFNIETINNISFPIVLINEEKMYKKFIVFIEKYYKYREFNTLPILKTKLILPKSCN